MCKQVILACVTECRNEINTLNLEKKLSFNDECSLVGDIVTSSILEKLKLRKEKQRETNSEKRENLENFKISKMCFCHFPTIIT